MVNININLYMITCSPGVRSFPRGNTHLIACNFRSTISNRSISWHVINTTQPFVRLTSFLIFDVGFVAVCRCYYAYLDGEGFEHRCSGESKSNENTRCKTLAKRLQRLKCVVK